LGQLFEPRFGPACKNSSLRHRKRDRFWYPNWGLKIESGCFLRPRAAFEQDSSEEACSAQWSLACEVLSWPSGVLRAAVHRGRLQSPKSCWQPRGSQRTVSVYRMRAGLEAQMWAQKRGRELWNFYTQRDSSSKVKVDELAKPRRHSEALGSNRRFRYSKRRCNGEARPIGEEILFTAKNQTKCCLGCSGQLWAIMRPRLGEAKLCFALYCQSPHVAGGIGAGFRSWNWGRGCCNICERKESLTLARGCQFAKGGRRSEAISLVQGLVTAACCGSCT
jgi:hypothetical protein